MTNLFSRDNGSPAPSIALRPTNWRKPTDPREHVCASCQGVASCGMNGAWYCTGCVPTNFWPAGRGE